MLWAVFTIQSENGTDSVRALKPDAMVTRTGKSTPRENGGIATLEPVKMANVIPSGRRKVNIQILHRPARSLVTVLEFLSPWNKVNPGYREYQSKRQAILSLKVHLVELDLLLKGRRMPFNERLPPGDYYYLVARGDQRPECEAFALSMRNALPTVPVPLRPPDADCMVNLQTVFATAYQRGRYFPAINYKAKPPVAVEMPLLTAARQQLRR